MPLQNRVTPFGEIVSVPERGLFMGNRGCLHDQHRRIRRQVCAERRWITCLLAFKNRKRTLMTPGHYTELFFLDEATALAAGHRPCGECRRDAYRRFKAAWLGGSSDAGLGESPSIDKIDRCLHGERLTDDREKRFYAANGGELPDGVFVEMPHTPDAWLVWQGKLHHWMPGGYDRQVALDADMPVNVLTPLSTVRALAAGYRPVVHFSAG